MICRSRKSIALVSLLSALLIIFYLILLIYGEVWLFGRNGVGRDQDLAAYQPEERPEVQITRQDNYQGRVRRPLIEEQPE